VPNTYIASKPQITVAPFYNNPNTQPESPICPSLKIVTATPLRPIDFCLCASCHCQPSPVPISASKSVPITLLYSAPFLCTLGPQINQINSPAFE
jgi:hypothetical protein